MPNTEDLCKKLNYTFKNIELLEEALRHSSFVNENRELNLNDNERLEFLGDAVLDLARDHALARPLVNSGRLSLPTPESPGHACHAAPDG